MKRNKILILAFVLLNLSIAQEKGILEKLNEVAIIDQKVMMPMRDGTRLATDIYRPKTTDKVPIIFSRTPYNFNPYKDGALVTRSLQSAYDAVIKGYAFVVQNERGRFFSEGEWDILGTPLTDGYDAFSWLSSQSWTTGKIATIGCSSTAEWQMAVASLDHPAHTTLVAQGYGAGVGKVGEYFEQGNWYRGGAVQLLFSSWLYGTQHDIMEPKLPKDITQKDLQRIQKFYDMAPRYPTVDWAQAFKHLPVSELLKNVDGPVGVFDKMIKRKPNDAEWFNGGLYHDSMPFNKPTFWFVSWYDVSTSPNLALYNHARKNAKDKFARDNQYLVIAPTLHCAFTRATENTIVGERNLGDARLNYDELIYNWFDFLLKGKENNFNSTTPKVKYFTMGSNKWQTSETWPPQNVKMTTYYLNSNGKANTRNGDGVLTFDKPKKDLPDNIIYDPLNPVPSHGGNVCCSGNAIQGGSFDQQTNELRNDVLVYTSDPLKKGTEVSGFIESTLFLSSDVKDTDVTIKLIDVYPDGKAYNLDETIQRVRYRDGYEKEVFMESGKVYEVNMTPMSTSNYFEAGHKIRIEISSSNFPRFDRNLNTGGNNFDESKPITAKNSIHHSSKYLSKIILPIVN